MLHLFIEISSESDLFIQSSVITVAIMIRKIRSYNPIDLVEEKAIKEKNIRETNCTLSKHCLPRTIFIGTLISPGINIPY